ncbi:hypothetical protein T484DRAFT_1801156 [Baffinella frigidus]|nr:hypothetical protein T484DRAFT_1801156 [Cryptophyta sp. CCMP2293]
MSSLSPLSYQAMMNLVHQTEDEEFDKRLDYAALMQTLGQGDKGTFTTLISRLRGPEEGNSGKNSGANPWKSSPMPSPSGAVKGTRTNGDACSATAAAAIYLQGWGTDMEGYHSAKSTVVKSRRNSLTEAAMYLEGWGAEGKAPPPSSRRPSSPAVKKVADARIAANAAAAVYFQGWEEAGAKSSQGTTMPRAQSTNALAHNSTSPRRRSSVAGSAAADAAAAALWLQGWGSGMEGAGAKSSHDTGAPTLPRAHSARSTDSPPPRRRSSAAGSADAAAAAMWLQGWGAEIASSQNAKGGGGKSPMGGLAHASQGSQAARSASGKAREVNLHALQYLQGLGL